MKNKNVGIGWSKLITWIVGVEVIGIAGSVFTAGSISSWYQFLNKPAFNPPNWLFGPVWTILYAMIGTVGYMLWQQKSNEMRTIKKLFVTQLVLNAIWSPIFFGAQRTDWALVIILALWTVIVGLMVKLWKQWRSLVWWIAPYLMWVSFASLLNFSVWLLN